MATDILQMLIDIFKISPQMVNKYAMVSPLEQIFYLFFFPTLFIIVLIYILSSHFMSEHKGLSILIAVAVYAFIIFQGLYNWFIFLSPYWLFVLLILGGIWIFFRPRGGGAKAMTAGAGGGILGGVFRQVNPIGGYRTDVDLLKSKIAAIYKLSQTKGQDKRETQNLIIEADSELQRLSKLVPGKGQNPEIKRLKSDLDKAKRAKAPSFIDKDMGKYYRYG